MDSRTGLKRNKRKIKFIRDTMNRELLRVMVPHVTMGHDTKRRSLGK